MYAFAVKLISALYALCALLPVQDKITLLSRQGKSPSLDLRLLEGALKAKMSDVRVRVCTTDPETINKSAFIFSIPLMVYHTATSRVCVTEGYIPAVSIPHLRKETTVIQMWHALGAIKKFGYQSVGAEGGRSAEAAKTLSMHRNYDWIIAGGPGAVKAYSEAFGYDASRVVALGMPRADYLLSKSKDSLRMQKVAALKKAYDFLRADSLKILYAPTLRRGESRKGWVSHEVEKLADSLKPYGCILVVVGHPLDSDVGGCVGDSKNVRYVPAAKSMDLAELCDCVITDYSAIAFEAALLEKPVFFYTPDIEEYRISTGLNIDPIVEFPGISSVDAVELAGKIAANMGLVDGSGSCQENEFLRYSRQYFAGIGEHATLRLSSFVLQCYSDTFETSKG